MLTWWPYLVSGLCGVLLAALVLALIMNPGFRRDLVAGQGKASLFGVVSVEGVIIVILAGMFLAGLLSPAWRVDSANNGGNPDVAQLQARIAEQQKKIAELGSPSTIDISRLPKLLTTLEPESEISKEIRAIAANSRGPWSPYSKSQGLLVSVPGEIADGFVRGCPSMHGKTLQLLSDYKHGDTVLPDRSPVIVTVTDLIFSASDCREKLKYDLQLNCRDAVRLFSDAVLTCGAGEQPMWKVQDHLLKVSAAVVIDAK